MVSNRRLYLSEYGGVVTEGRLAASLLVGEGCEIDEKILLSLGCTIENGVIKIPGEKVKEVPPENKVHPAPANKLGGKGKRFK